MRSRTLTVRQLDADRKPLGELVVIAIDPDTVTFDFSVTDGVYARTEPIDLASVLPSGLSQPPG